MRGKAALALATLAKLRITPAYAGKSTSFRKLPCSCQDHPRLCGEKRFPDRHRQRGTGSPPPMRGKGHLRHSCRNGSRITPAYAGKSHKPCSTTLQKRDHPRLCGEKAVQRGDITGMSGSPPPMRGKVFQSFTQCPNFGITPAYAGKRPAATIFRTL